MPFLGKFPELYKWFKDFLGYEESGKSVEAIPSSVARIQAADKPGVEHAAEIGEKRDETADCLVESCLTLSLFFFP